MAAHRKVKNEREMWEKWQAFKDLCDNQLTRVTDFSPRFAEHVTSRVPKSITYTIEGFCLFLGMARKTFYECYAKHPKFEEVVTMIREECEVDARKKFELGVIPTQLAGLWMSRYGYTTKTESDVTGAVPVVIAGEDGLED